MQEQSIPLPVHHIGYITRDFERSSEIYKMLGFTAQREPVVDPVQHNRIQFLEKPGDGFRIELIEPLTDSTMKNWPEGVQHICFDASAIADFAGWFRKQKLGKIYTKEIPAAALGGRKVCFACMADRAFAEFILRS